MAELGSPLRTDEGWPRGLHTVKNVQTQHIVAAGRPAAGFFHGLDFINHRRKQLWQQHVLTQAATSAPSDVISKIHHSGIPRRRTGQGSHFDKELEVVVIACWQLEQFM